MKGLDENFYKDQDYKYKLHVFRTLKERLINKQNNNNKHHRM